MWCAYIFKVIKEFFMCRNFDVYHASLVYDVQKPETGTLLASSSFWREEQESWGNEKLSEHWVAVYREYKNGKLFEIMKRAPYFVSNMVLRLNYTYNNKKYKYISNRYPSVWPLPKSIGFKAPIKEARLVGVTKTTDVTNKIKKYAGPDYDFHGEEINVRDLFFISLDDYTFLEITDILNRTKKVNIDSQITLPLF